MVTTTRTAHPEKITHALSVLNNAGLSNDGQNKAQGTATTTHAEKITHAVNTLTNAGLSDSSSSKHDSKKWIIIGSIVAAICFLIAILCLLFIFLRARRRRGAYASMGKGIDMKDNEKAAPANVNPAQGAPPQPGMRGFLMPAWRTRKNKDVGPQGEAAPRGPSIDLDLSSRRSSFDASAHQTYESRGRNLSISASRSRDGSRDDRSRSRSLAPRVEGAGRFSESTDVFNAEKEMMPSEGDSMLVGPKIAERNFESGYDGMDTSYGGMVGRRGGGDRRSYGA